MRENTVVRSTATLPRAFPLALLALAGALTVPFAASAAGSDELWEVSTQMNIPGMPAGMGAQTAQVCRDKDPRKETVSRKDMQDCKVTDVKESGTRFTMTMSCPRGPVTIDQTYNAGRTEYKGTIRMSDGGREMVMVTSGRKIGACDAQQARQEMAGKVAAAKGRGEEARRQADAVMIAACNEGASGMNAGQFGVYGACRADAATCGKIKADIAKNQPAVASACSAKVSEFCARYQTQDGFARAKGSRDGADMCGLDAAKVRVSLCAGALQSESLEFLGGYCPAEARQLAQKQCAGRDFTSMSARYRGFCSRYLASTEETEQGSASTSSRARPVARGGDDAGQKRAADEAVQQGITKGLGALKGLFGR